MIRKHFIYILLGALVFLSAQGLLSCRVFKKSKTKADSTISRTEQKSQNWTSEIVTELIVDPSDSILFSDLDSVFNYPAVFGLSPAESQKVFSVLKYKKPISAASASIKTKAGKVMIRRIEKSTGQISEQKQKQKEIKVDQSQKSREPGNTGQMLTAISICTLLVIIVVILLRQRTK